MSGNSFRYRNSFFKVSDLVLKEKLENFEKKMEASKIQLLSCYCTQIISEISSLPHKVGQQKQSLGSCPDIIKCIIHSCRNEFVLRAYVPKLRVKCSAVG